MTLFLHIGSTKTATTSIQRFLTANRGLLLENGYIFPSYIGGNNHKKLVVYANDDDYYTVDFRYNVRTPDDRQRFRQEFSALFRANLAGVKEHVILSSEHCSALLRTVDDINRLKDLIASVCQDIKVIFYARQQAEFMASLYSTHIVTGDTIELIYPPEDRIQNAMNYYEILMRWEQVFGRENIVARIFDRDQMVGGDVIEDFCSILGIDDAVLAKATIPARLNESLDFKTVEFLRLFNMYQPQIIDKKINPARSNIAQILQKLSNKPRIRIPKKMFDQLRKEMNEPNSLFRERYIDGVKEDPFKWNWEENTGKRTIQNLTIEEAFRIFSRVWSAKLREIASGNNRNRTDEEYDLD
ncbi:MAG: hypothetical protein GDA41_01215 [Rhodospirillales bacterium]|nr:hypothetical protein [Rhodospirillales bacterium]